MAVAAPIEIGIGTRPPGEAQVQSPRTAQFAAVSFRAGWESLVATVSTDFLPGSGFGAQATGTKIEGAFTADPDGMSQDVLEPQGDTATAAAPRSATFARATPSSPQGSQPPATMNPGPPATNSNFMPPSIPRAPVPATPVESVPAQQPAAKTEDVAQGHSRAERDIETRRSATGTPSTRDEPASVGAPASPLFSHAPQPIPMPVGGAPTGTSQPRTSQSAYGHAPDAAPPLGAALPVIAGPQMLAAPLVDPAASSSSALPASAPVATRGTGVQRAGFVSQTNLLRQTGAVDGEDTHLPQMPAANHEASSENDSANHPATAEIPFRDGGVSVAGSRTYDDSLTQAIVDESPHTSAVEFQSTSPSPPPQATLQPQPHMDSSGSTTPKGAAIPLRQSPLNNLSAPDSGPSPAPVPLRASSPADTTPAGVGSGEKVFARNEREGTVTAPVAQIDHTNPLHSAAGPQIGLMPARSPGEASGAASAPAQPLSSAAPDSSTPTRDAFAALDEVTTPAVTPTWVHAGAQRAEAGYQDPALGWVSVRADLGGGGVHASLVPGSADAATALDGHLAGLNTFLTEHHTGLAAVTVSAPEVRWGDAGTGQNTGQEAGQDPQRGMGQSPQQDSGHAFAQDSHAHSQRSETADAVQDHSEDAIPLGSLNGRPTAFAGGAGVHISVLA